MIGESEASKLGGIVWVSIVSVAISIGYGVHFASKVVVQQPAGVRLKSSQHPFGQEDCLKWWVSVRWWLERRWDTGVGSREDKVRIFCTSEAIKNLMFRVTRIPHPFSEVAPKRKFKYPVSMFVVPNLSDV